LEAVAAAAFRFLAEVAAWPAAPPPEAGGSLTRHPLQRHLYAVARGYRLLQ
jgi:hypothetical protein